MLRGGMSGQRRSLPDSEKRTWGLSNLIFMPVVSFLYLSTISTCKLNDKKAIVPVWHDRFYPGKAMLPGNRGRVS